MNKNILTACLIGFSAIFQASAQLAITEVMSGENDANHPDWFELHNYGTNDIDLSGYSWNDDGHSGFSGADTAPFAGVTIHSNETIICTAQKGAIIDAASFRTWWNELDSGIQVVVLTSGDPGLSANPLETGVNRADSVRLWRTNLTALGSDTIGLDLDECPDYLVQRVDLGVTTNQSLLFDPASGTYDVISTEGMGGAFVCTNGEVGSPGVAPSAVAAKIVQTPLGQVVTVGDSVSFTNGGSALPPLVFRWYFNDTPITSQTPGVSIRHLTAGMDNSITNDVSVLALTGVQTTNAGTYKVIASNGLESFTNAAVLTVNTAQTAPSILSVKPDLVGSFDAYFGQTPTFSVLASGFPAPTYQWFKDNNPLAGEINSDLVLPLGDTNQSGVYSVMVANAAGGTNATFTLNVTPVPNLVITEVMSGESTNRDNGDPSGHSDWFELSNFGDFPVNLYGYRIDDNHNSLSASTSVTTPTIIHPGESVVFVQNMTPDEFRAWWGANLSSSAQIIDYNGSGQGLSGSGDAVNLWNAVATDNSDHAAAEPFGVGTVGNSFGFDLAHLDQTGFEGALTTNGVDGAFVATVGGDIGSPGAVMNLPRFTSLKPTTGGVALSWVSQPNWNYTIQYKTNLADSIWTTLSKVMSGDTNVMDYTDTTSDTRRFYRVFLNLNNQ